MERIGWTLRFIAALFSLLTLFGEGHNRGWI